jgi:hypothetical protein
MLMVSSLIAITFGVLLVLFALVILAWVRTDQGAADDDEGDAGGGGGSSRPSRPDRPRDPDGEPVWWPEFERQFAEWVEHPQVGVLRPG